MDVFRISREVLEDWRAREVRTGRQKGRQTIHSDINLDRVESLEGKAQTLIILGELRQLRPELLQFKQNANSLQSSFNDWRTVIIYQWGHSNGTNE